MEPNEHDPIVRRLNSMGDQPVDPEVAARHRSLLASVPVAPARSRLRPLMVGSLLAGSLLGGMGLAAAAPRAILPEAASNAAQSALATVTLGVVDPPGHGDEADHEAPESPEAPDAVDKADNADNADKAGDNAEHGANDGNGVTRSQVGCPAGFTGNHGEYVSSVTDNPATADVDEHQVAAHSECGKPVHPDHPAKPDANAHKPEHPGKSDEPHGDGAAKPETDEQVGPSEGHQGAPAEDPADAADDGPGTPGTDNSGGHGPSHR